MFKTYLNFLTSVLGVMLLASGLYVMSKKMEFLKSASLAQGQVVGFAGAANTQKWPIVRYKDSDERIIRLISKDAARFLKLKVGDSVGVYYLPLDPTRAEVKSFSIQWLRALCVTIPGLILALGGWLRLKLKRRT